MELLKKCLIPIFTAILVAIVNYLYIRPLENKMEKLNEANNIIVDIIIEDAKYMYRNFPKYFDIIKKKNDEGALSSHPDYNTKEREEILSSFDPSFTRLTHLVTLMSILSKEKYKETNIEAFKREIEEFNDSFLGSTNIDNAAITKNKESIKKLEAKFFNTIVDISKLLQDYISKR